jgi:hypothetical protein
MSDITANVVVSNPRPIFTDSRTFRAVANGRIYIGLIDTDPVNPANQIPVYIENEDGSHVQISQPLIINAAGKIVYNGQLVKIVTVQGHSMAIYDAYGSQVDYIANVLKYDPDQFSLYAESVYKKWPYKKVMDSSFQSGYTLTEREQVLVDSSSGYYYQYTGILPKTVSASDYPPNNDWICVGLLSAHELSDPLNWGVEYGTTTEQKDKFQLQMDSLSKMGGGTIWLDGFIYLKDTINLIVPDPIYVTNQANYFLKVPDNITIKSKRGYNAGFRVADGVVAANQGIQYSKGFQVFSDVGRKVTNFRAEGFAIDYNGKNNLLPPLSVSDPQALCPGFWFIQGEDIYIDDILHIECSGQQCVVLDYLVNKCAIRNNTFYHCGGTLLGNNNINDHSSIFCLASNYVVSGNKGIGYENDSDSRLSYESTFIECHGQHGIIKGNKCHGYNCGAVFAAIRNDLFDVVHDGNAYYHVGYGINYGGANNRNFDLLSQNNEITLRPNKPLSHRPATCHGSTPSEFASYTYPITAILKLRSINNTFIQSAPNLDWDGNSVGDNMIFEGGKFTETYLDDNIYGVKSGYRLDYPAGNKFVCRDRLYGCGNSNDPDNIQFKTSVFQMQNIEPGFNQSILPYVDIDIKLDKDCLYTSLYYFDTSNTPKVIKSNVSAHHWTGIYAGNDPVSSDSFIIRHTYSNVITGLGLQYNSTNMQGKIAINENTSFIKTGTNASPWIYRGVQDLNSAPTSPRPFGDRRGDTITPQGMNPGSPSLLVCVTDGVDASTVGTWKGAGIIST